MDFPHAIALEAIAEKAKGRAKGKANSVEKEKAKGKQNTLRIIMVEKEKRARLTALRALGEEMTAALAAQSGTNRRIVQQGSHSPLTTQSDMDKDWHQSQCPRLASVCTP